MSSWPHPCLLGACWKVSLVPPCDLSSWSAVWSAAPTVTGTWEPGLSVTWLHPDQEVPVLSLGGLPEHGMFLCGPTLPMGLLSAPDTLSSRTPSQVLWVSPSLM